MCLGDQEPQPQPEDPNPAPAPPEEGEGDGESVIPEPVAKPPMSGQNTGMSEQATFYDSLQCPEGHALKTAPGNSGYYVCIPVRAPVPIIYGA